MLICLLLEQSFQEWAELKRDVIGRLSVKPCSMNRFDMLSLTTAWHTKLAPAVLAAVKTEFSYVIIPHRSIGYIAIWITWCRVLIVQFFQLEPEGRKATGASCIKLNVRRNL